MSGHGWVKSEEYALDVVPPWPRRTRQASIPRRGWVAHVGIHGRSVSYDKQQAVAVVLDAAVPMVPEDTSVTLPTPWWGLSTEAAPTCIAMRG
jgi:hypothetical protein